MKRFWALLISAFLVLVGLKDLYRVLGQGCTSTEYRGVQAPACGIDGYLHASAWIAFGLAVGYLIWTYRSPTKNSAKKYRAGESDR